MLLLYFLTDHDPNLVYGPGLQSDDFMEKINTKIGNNKIENPVCIALD